MWISWSKVIRNFEVIGEAASGKQRYPREKAGKLKPPLRTGADDAAVGLDCGLVDGRLVWQRSA